MIVLQLQSLKLILPYVHRAKAECILSVIVTVSCDFFFRRRARRKSSNKYNNRGGDQPQPSTRYFKVIKNYRFCGSSLFEEKGRKERGRRGGKNSTVNWLELIEFFIVAKVPQNFRTNDNRPTISVDRGE